MQLGMYLGNHSKQTDNKCTFYVAQQPMLNMEKRESDNTTQDSNPLSLSITALCYIHLEHIHQCPGKPDHAVVQWNALASVCRISQSECHALLTM